MPAVSYDAATLKLLDLLQNNAELSTAELAAAVVCRHLPAGGVSMT